MGNDFNTWNFAAHNSPDFAMLSTRYTKEKPPLPILPKSLYSDLRRLMGFEFIINTLDRKLNVLSEAEAMRQLEVCSEVGASKSEQTTPQ